MKSFLDAVTREYETEQPLELNKPFKIVFKPSTEATPKSVSSTDSNDTQTPLKAARMVIDGTYRVKVKKYMTKQSSPTFDFMDKWNDGVPMPLVEMVGTVEKQTPGMYYMHLHGEVNENATTCMHCGRKLTNPVSKLYGLGPECGQHAYINPYNTEEELMQHMEEIKTQLRSITWKGWIIKSAITEWEEV